MDFQTTLIIKPIDETGKVFKPTFNYMTHKTAVCTTEKKQAISIKNPID